jgi:outer membrane protein assembly factor BamB/tetratricopeptide (TPR) repeat protein
MTSLWSGRAFPFLAFNLPRRVGLAIALVVAACPWSGSVAQVGNRTATKFYPDFSDTADALLRNATGHERDKQWAEAIEIYQRVIQQFGDKVARLPKLDAAAEPGGDSVLYVDIRQFCQRRLAGLPPEARALYRSRVDTAAERWFRQGLAGRDRAILRRVIDQAFCSSWGDDAVELLGDLAFQDGRFDEAMAAYRRLVSDQPGEGAGLVHPDPSVDLPRVAAKKLLCRAALDDNPPGPGELEAFVKAFPGAAGELAGREGPYAEVLATALKLDRLAPAAQPDGRWPTFAGAATRSRVVPGPVDVGSLQWRVDLERVEPGRGSHRFGRGITTIAGQTRPDRLLAYHPIVLDDQVILCDDGGIFAYNLNDRPDGPPGSPSGTVKVAWRHDEEHGSGVPQATRMSVGIPRFTLTAFGDRVYARLGLTTIPFLGRAGISGGSQSYLVAVDRATDGKLLWKRPSGDVIPSRRPADGPNRNIGFEGSPVADARNVYVALTDRREQTSTFVAALDGETGATRWVRYLGAASSDAENIFGMGGMGMGMGMGGGVSNDFGHRLLSLDGPTLYYQTNLGAVAALDAESGAIRWVATYPRQDRMAGAGHERDLNPAVVHDGLVIVAPEDAAAIFAFDAAGGRLVWKTDPLPDEVKLAHLLGVAKGRLVATGDRVLLFDTKNGKLLHSWPDNGHGYEGYGRGLLAGDKIYWPTRNEIHVLDQATGLRTEPPIKLQESFQEVGGNLAVGDGYLIVAQTDKLVVFCQNRRLIQRYREEIARAPEQAAPHYRMAQAAEATGQDDLALESLGRAQELARASETIDGAPLPAASRDHRFRLLMKMGEKARGAGELAAAERRYGEAAAAARVDRDRLRARLSEADAQLDRGATTDSVATLQGLLSEEPLRALTVAAEEGRRTIRADLLIAARLAAIVKDHGRSLYAPFDREARELLEKGKAAGDPRQLEEVGRSYPVADVVPDSLLALARLNDAAKHPAESARAYKRLLAAATSDALRARALLGLARAYEAQKLWVPARDAYTQALARFPEASVEFEELGTEARLGVLVARRLEQPPFDRMTGDRAEPSLPVPLARRWGKSLDGPVRPMAADGVPPSPEAGRVFLAQGTVLRPVDSASGGSRWSAELSGTPIWVGYLDDRVLAATETRLVALALDTGQPLWQFDASTPGSGRRGADPFARRDPASKTVPEPAGKLHGFRVVGSRVFCLRGDRELIAFDGDTGLIDWSFNPPAAVINPELLVGPERVVLQVRKPNSVLVLDTATGRRRGEYPQTEDEEWARPPLPLDDDHVVVVADRRTVTRFDLTRGVTSWVFRESREMPKNGPPRPFGDAERLMLVHDGNELIRLDAATGVKRWSRPLGSEDLSERPEALAVDGERVYWVSGQTLNGARLRDGALAWSRHLSGPESGWVIDLTERSVLAYPGLPRKAENELEGLPLVFRRRDDGRLVQRLLFPVPVTEVAVRLSPGGAVVATQSGLWALGDRAAVDGRGRGR